MNIGIAGRHRPLLETAMATAARVGHAAKGTLDDDEAIAWMRDGAIEALVIGGGVEQASRQTLLEACATCGVRPVEVFGPALLEKALLEL